MRMISDDIDYIDTISNEISLYIESTQRVIDSIKHLNSMRDTHYLEATSNDEKPSILKRMKESISKIIAKLKMMIAHIFKKSSPALNKYQKVEKIGKELNNICVQGIPLGNVKINIPNIMEYDKRLLMVITKSAAEVSMKSYKEYSKKINGENKIDILTNSVNDITSKLNAYSVTDNNIKTELKKLNKVEGRMSMGQRSTPAMRETVYNNVNNVPENKSKKKKKDSNGVNNINSQYVNQNEFNQQLIRQASRDSITALHSTELAMRDSMNAMSIHQDMDRQFNDTAALHNQMHNSMMMASVDDNEYCDYDTFTENITGDVGSLLWKTMPAPMKAVFVVNFSLIALGVGVSAYNLIKWLPTSVKNETITVSELYRRIQTISPEQCESSLNKIISQVESNTRKEKTINDFANAEAAMLQYMNSIQRLISAYTKFKQAELDYYCRILIEIYSKLAIDDNHSKKK